VLLGDAVAAPVAVIAIHAVLQAGCLTLLATITTIGLTQGDLKNAVGLSLLTILAVGIGLFGVHLKGANSLVYSGVTTMALAIVLGAAMIFMRRIFGIVFDLTDATRIVCASVVMAAVVLVLQHMQGPLTPVPEVVGGSFAFVAMVLLLRVNSVRRIISGVSGRSEMKG
jgi:hypothetical protein